jgi:predicted Zn-dependent peptidase
LKEKYKKTVLDNGIRVVSERIDYVRSVSIGVWIDVGSRDEKIDEAGASHFIEHMLFKGTKKRNAKEIAASLESVGGSLNAFTGREQTCYFARVLDEHVDKALDVLSDIIKNPRFNRSHLEKERAVIISEIKELEDSPADLVHDLLMSSVWKENSLGRPIIGTTQSVMNLTRAKLLSFMKRNYTTPRMVVAASGNLKHEELISKIKRKFNLNSNSHSEQKDWESPQGMPRLEVVRKNTSQTHISLGIPIFPYRDKRRYTALVLSSILGGGMSSRLFQNIREKLGLVYSVYSFLDFFEDAGILGIYLGTHKKNTAWAVELVLREIKRLKRNSIAPKELSRAKYQLKGNLLLALENTSNRMNRLARYELLLQDYVGVDQSINLINRIKAKDLVKLAGDFFTPDNLSTVVLGPVDKDVLKNVDWSKI